MEYLFDVTKMEKGDIVAQMLGTSMVLLKEDNKSHHPTLLVYDQEITEKPLLQIPHVRQTMFNNFRNAEVAGQIIKELLDSTTVKDELWKMQEYRYAQHKTYMQKDMRFDREEFEKSLINTSFYKKDYYENDTGSLVVVKLTQPYNGSNMYYAFKKGKEAGNPVFKETNVSTVPVVKLMNKLGLIDSHADEIKVEVAAEGPTGWRSIPTLSQESGKISVPESRYQSKNWDKDLNGEVSRIRECKIENGEDTLNITITIVQSVAGTISKSSIKYIYRRKHGAITGNIHHMPLPEWAENIKCMHDICENPMNRSSSKIGIPETLPLYEGSTLWLTADRDYWVDLNGRWIPTTGAYIETYLSNEEEIYNEYILTKEF